MRFSRRFRILGKMEQEENEASFCRWLNTRYIQDNRRIGEVSWTYERSSGKMFDPGGMLVGFGYSGIGIGKNNPEAENIEDVGPIPQGIYTIGPPHDTVE